MPDPRSKWEQSVDAAMGACTRVFGDGLDANGDGLVIYTPIATGISYPVDGIFESQSEQVSIENGMEVVSYQPMFSANLSAFQAMPARRDTLLIRGKTYYVVEPNADGHGTVSLRLHEQ